MSRPWLSLLPLILCPALPCHAVPGEAEAVIRHCGPPRAEQEGTSEVTNGLQRDLVYDDTTLHFVPDGTGWSFTTAWRGSFPITRSALETSMPCFHVALADAAAHPLAPIDPTVARQTQDIQAESTGWGVPHLDLIALFAIVVLMLVLWPRRQSRVSSHLPAARRTRKPGVPIRFIRRRPRQDITE